MVQEVSEQFSDGFDVFTDRSVDREIDSVDPEYVIRTIRENFISGSSITIVLCGALTYGRKFVDWEIKATLDKQHALLGIILPTNPRAVVPIRLDENIRSGFAHWSFWPDNRQDLLDAVAEARHKAKDLSRIRIDSPMMGRNTT